MSLEVLWAGWRHEYVVKATAEGRSGEEEAGGEPACVFCRIIVSGPPSEDNAMVWRGEHAVAVLNAYPYAPGHLLVMPIRHVAELSELSADEKAELWGMLETATDVVTDVYNPDGLNMGANLGRAAGAGIPAHLHLHVLPRWSGDTNFMTTVAGVRVIPESLSVTWQRVRAAWPNS